MFNSRRFMPKQNNLNIVNIICAVLLVILIVVLIICLATKKDKFSNSHKNFDDCEILMFDREGCGYSKKMKKLIEENNFMIGDKYVYIVDISNKELADKYNANGTPHFALKSNPSVFSSGYAPIAVHDAKLNGQSDNHKASKGKIKVVGRHDCPFCMQSYALLDELNIDYEKIQVGTDLANQYMEKHKANGVPLTITLEGEAIIGFQPDKFKGLANK